MCTTLPGSEPELKQALAGDGFLILREVLSQAEVAEVAGRLHALYNRFTHLPASHAQDISTGGTAGAPGIRSAEINRAVKLDKGLRQTAAFRRCLAIARQLRGPLAGYSFDHAIAKLPQGNAETPWHQDQVYTGHHVSLNTVHFWIPLQDVDEDNGCMHFVPGSHLRGLVPHRELRNASGGVAFAASPPEASQVVAAPIAVGSLTVHTPLTLHYTGPNRTDSIRHAWVLHFGPLGWIAKLRPGVLFQQYLAARIGGH